METGVKLACGRLFLRDPVRGGREVPCVVDPDAWTITLSRAIPLERRGAVVNQVAERLRQRQAQKKAA